MTTGIRETKNKLRWRNFPMFLIRPLIEVAHFGEAKYETFNFLKGQTILNCTDAIKRHLDKFEDPDISDLDEESGVNHLAHVAWNALVALHMLKKRPDLDDRYKGFQFEPLNRLRLSEEIERLQKDPEVQKMMEEIKKNDKVFVSGAGHE